MSAADNKASNSAQMPPAALIGSSELFGFLVLTLPIACHHRRNALEAQRAFEAEAPSWAIGLVYQF